MAERTTFSIDGIGRNVCNTLEEATQQAEGIDVVVIGSGMYGGFCASEIYKFSLTNKTFRGKARQPLRVVVLEAGPFLALEHAQNLPDVGLTVPGKEENVSSGANPGIRDLVWGQGWRSNVPYMGQAYVVGGKSLYWGGWSPHQHSVRDLPQWPKDMVHYMTEAVFPNPQLYSLEASAKGAYEYMDWKIGVLPADDFVFDQNTIPTEVTSGLNKVLLDFMNEKGKSIKINTALAPIAVSTRSDASGLFANNKFSSLPGLISCVRRDHSGSGPVRFAIVPNCHVRYLRTAKDNNGNNTRVVQFIDVIENGVKKTLQISPHTQVVLAGSCIESTRLALESFSLVDTGLLPPGQELIGNNLHAHHRFDLKFRINRSFLDDYLKSKGKAALSRLLQVTALHLDGEAQPGKPGYQFQLFAASNTLSGDFHHSESPDDLLYKLVPDLDLARFISEHQDSPQITIILRASGEMATNRTNKRNNASDFIDLAGPADYDHGNDHKRAWVQWGSHYHDEIWALMYDKAIAVAKLFGPDITYWNGYAWDKNPPNIDFVLYQQGLGTTYHEAGTMWMGEQPVTAINTGDKAEVSVLDSGGHFHHVTNAYNCDQAAFPTCAVANPVPTGLIVARKVAADIFGRHSNLYNKYVPDKPEDKFVPLISGFDAFGQEWKWTGTGSYQLQQATSAVDLPDWLLNFTGNGGDGFLQFIKKQFRDVDLRLEWKSFRVAPGDPLPLAGILFNSAAIDSTVYDKSVLIPINQAAKYTAFGKTTYGDSLYKTGSVYGVAPATRWMAKAEAPYNFDGYWNEFQISLKGGKVNVKLNNKYVVTDALLPAFKNSSGFIALIINTGHVQFRSIRAREL